MEIDNLSGAAGINASAPAEYDNAKPKAKPEQPVGAKTNKPERGEAAQNANKARGKAKNGGGDAAQKAEREPEFYERRESKSSKDVLDKAIEEANKKITGYNKEFKYSVHEVTRDIMIKVIDTETNEIVKEIPPKKTLDAIAKMWELAGILVDEKR